MRVRAYHYSNEEIEIGSLITSNQARNRTYSLVHGIYKRVNPDLPDVYGYAYPEQKEFLRFKHCYIVESEELVIAGDFNHSVYLNMDSGCRCDNSLPLKERLQKRDNKLLEQAKLYFLNAVPGRTELISSGWKVVEKI